MQQRYTFFRAKRALSMACLGGFLLGGGQLFGQQTGAVTVAASLRVGDTAPDFAMPDQTGKPVKLSDFKGKKNVVLAFYVLAFTTG
ncbi:MAG: redoxin domain-containing protein [Acidobacteria bacterium]|nr:redoxin domain-containing protein [Acidobacteriota bacterium]MBI3655861.1 redoxin domain-containing protein [Acidobacteriota bacterium]